jgi:hypothetical protein
MALSRLLITTRRVWMESLGSSLDGGFASYTGKVGRKPTPNKRWMRFGEKKEKNLKIKCLISRGLMNTIANQNWHY